jgi:hypothetical protein
VPKSKKYLFASRFLIVVVSPYFGMIHGILSDQTFGLVSCPFNQAITQVAAVESAARVSAVRAAAQANIKRRQAVESYAAKIGAKLPEEKDLQETEEFKSKMMARFQNSIPDSARGQSAGLIVDSVLEDSFNKVRLDPKAGPAKMNVDLAVSLAKQAGISPDELDEMLTAIEDPTNKDVSQYLRENILPRLRERDEAGSRGLADALPTRKFPKMNLDTQTSSTAC